MNKITNANFAGGGRLVPAGGFGLGPNGDGWAGYGSSEFGYPTREEDEGRLNPLQLLFYALQYRWVILAITILSLLAGLAFTGMQTPTYRAIARLEIMMPSAKVFQDMEVVVQGNDLRALQTASEKIRSRGLAERVVYELSLSEDVAFLFPAPDIAPSNILRRAFGSMSTPSLNDLTAEQREQRAIARVRNNLGVEIVRNTSILEIGFSNQNPEMAKTVVNQVAQSFLDQRVDQTSETSDLARQFIQEQVLQVKDKLQTSEKELVAYAKEAGLTIDDNNSSLILNSIRDINEGLSNAVQERLDRGRWVQQVDAGNQASLPRVLESEGIQKLRERIAGLRADYQQKLGTLKPAFPEMRQLQAQIDELNAQVDQAVGVLANAARLEYQDAQAKEAELRAKLSELETQQSDFQDRNIQYTILKREVDSNRSQYESLISKLNDLGVSAELKSQNAEIVDRAIAPGSPYSPRLPLNLAIALAFAIMASGSTIYVSELMNNTFSGPDQIEKELRLPVLGIIPLLASDVIKADLDDPRSGLAEAYRSLRTALQFSGTEGNPKSLLVTSAEPSEGKSTTSFKLAQDFSALGSKVLVIDADLRKPNMHRLFEQSNTIGLSNLLTNTASPEDLRKIIKRTGFENVLLLTSGTLPPNPADLLSSAKMAQLMLALSERFDMIIIDAPPIIGLSDAPILGRLTEGTLLVVSSGQVPRKAAQASLKRLKTAGANVLGACLTKFAVKKFDYNYSYGYINSKYYTYGLSGEATPALEDVAVHDPDTSFPEQESDADAKPSDDSSRVRRDRDPSDSDHPRHG